MCWRKENKQNREKQRIVGRGTATREQHFVTAESDGARISCLLATYMIAVEKRGGVLCASETDQFEREEGKRKALHHHHLPTHMH